MNSSIYSGLEIPCFYMYMISCIILFHFDGTAMEISDGFDLWFVLGKK